MEHVILAFLMMRPLSPYDLLMAFSKDVSPFYKASLGSIQTRLEKLEQSGYVISQIDTSTKRRRKIYTITQSGQKRYKDWMMAEITESKFESEIVNKIFFLGLLEQDDRLKVVKGFIKFLETKLEEFQQEEIDNQNNDIPPKYKDVVKYQLKTLELGIFQYKNILKWCKQLLNEINGDIK